MSARPNTGGLGLLIPAALALLAIAVGTSTGRCGPPEPTPAPTERPLQTGVQPASPP